MAKWVEYVNFDGVSLMHSHIRKGKRSHRGKLPIGEFLEMKKWDVVAI